MSEKNLDHYRAEIAKIDDAIIELLIKRFELTDDVGVFKKKHGLPIENLDVEKKILARLADKCAGKIDAAALEMIYSEIFEESKRRQKGI
jgi:chorismate mutase